MKIIHTMLMVMIVFARAAPINNPQRQLIKPVGYKDDKDDPENTTTQIENETREENIERFRIGLTLKQMDELLQAHCYQNEAIQKMQIQINAIKQTSYSEGTTTGVIYTIAGLVLLKLFEYLLRQDDETESAPPQQPIRPVKKAVPKKKPVPKKKVITPQLPAEEKSQPLPIATKQTYPAASIASPVPAPMTAPVSA